MTQPQDSDLEPGAASVPTPNVSEVLSDKPSSGASSKKAVFQELIESPEFEAYIEKKVQSKTDRRLSKVDNLTQKVEELTRQKAYLEAAGGDPVKAAREMHIDQLLSGDSVGNTVAPEPTKQTLSEFELATRELLQELGIGENDPELIALSKNPYNGKAAWFADVTRLADKRKQEAPTAPLINDMPGKTPGLGNQEAKRIQLYSELDKLLPNPVTNQDKIRDLRARISALG